MSEPGSAWIGLAGVIVGALIGGGGAWLNSFLQDRRQRKQERDKLHREKLEQLYEAVSQLKQSYIGDTASSIATLAKREPYKNIDSPVPIERLQMLVGLYGETLQPQLAGIMKARDNYAQILIKRVGLERGTDLEIRQFFGELQPLSLGMDKACEEMQKAIVELSKSYM